MSNILEQIHCLSSFGMIQNEEIEIKCSEAKIKEIIREVAGSLYPIEEKNIDYKDGLTVFYCGVKYIFKNG